MGIISRAYIKDFVGRYDKEVGVPYYSHTDFQNFKQEVGEFTNSKGVKIHYFYYFYPKYREDKIILFCHGLGPGHAAYIAEIEALARRGYKVLTLDYTGCDESGGKYLGSLNTPTRDVLELLDYLNLNTSVALMGHSMGGYTALNVINLRKDITVAVILSGFLSVSSIITSAIKSRFIASGILRYERKVEPTYFDLHNIEYLKATDDKLFFIQSEDDAMIPYTISLKVVEEINNHNIKTLKVQNRKHNPNYTDAATKYMNAVFGKYYNLLKQKKLRTDEEKIAYFKDVSLAKLVEQDEEMFDQIAEFIDQ